MGVVQRFLLLSLADNLELAFFLWNMNFVAGAFGLYSPTPAFQPNARSLAAVVVGCAYISTNSAIKLFNSSDPWVALVCSNSLDFAFLVFK